MIIRTKGKPEKVALRECKLAVRFAADQLITSRMQENLEIRLWFWEGEFLRKKEWDGYADWLDDNLKPRLFVVSLDPALSHEKVISATLHEMVHIKQFATGQMKDYRRMKGVVGWMGKLHKDSRGDKISSPWEQEALRMEKKLYRQFKEYLDTV